MLKDLVLKNRSYRGFDESRVISKDELLELVELARLSPSSMNKQPLKYKLVFEKEEVESLLKLTFWARNLPDIQLPREGKHPTAFIVICVDLNIGESVQRFQKDIGIVAQTMVLGSVELGLSGCMIGNYNVGDVANELALPSNLVPALVIAFGKPNEEIVLTEIGEGEDTNYYRDENDVHYVPKKKLVDLIIN